MQNIGKVLKIARIANNMSCKQASEATNVSAIYINELETGKKSHVSEAYLSKLANGYGLILEQLVELEMAYTSLEKFYTNILGGDKRLYRQVLIRTLDMIETNCELRIKHKLSRSEAHIALLFAENVEYANEIVEKFLGPASVKEKIACITGMFDVPEIIDRQPEDTDEQVYYMFLTHIINGY